MEKDHIRNFVPYDNNEVDKGIYALREEFADATWINGPVELRQRRNKGRLYQIMTARFRAMYRASSASTVKSCKIAFLDSIKEVWKICSIGSCVALIVYCVGFCRYWKDRSKGYQRHKLYPA
ncbi:hypothetical protein RND71_029714 [Anisodus tanguticus]|uniref:Uncharacterized protein n=1 Tax=Anisodus tanguticus TaxID=243964 RepID=A0AAE1REK6_9SOLA|nr:hypothetical protein RND71_029714 [Anisodus tanguticus]